MTFFPTRNYLRVRGEYNKLMGAGAKSLELPPRTRRIHLIAPIGDVDHGTTSAYAENTEGGSPVQGSPGNYLRVRGEYPTIKPHIILLLELPPRTRRIHTTTKMQVKQTRTTSAYAENTGCFYMRH